MIDKNAFTDKVRITVKAGDGGDGMNSFKAYKGKPACGPDGGDGGKGGDVYFVGDKDRNDLLSFRFRSRYFAENGQRGGTNLCTGKSGEDLLVAVPLGTVVRDCETGKVLCDIVSDGEKTLIARGGRGGKGNVRFATSRRRAPAFAQKGEKTEQHAVLLELKVIADVGIVGFPNVGKSTLLGTISAARPKIADYHFTTLSPNLGVVSVYDESFVAADIPGLIEGAAAGAGLGHEFLKHIERTRMLLHVVDISGSEGRDPVADFRAINREIAAYSETLSALPQVVACNKTDLPGAEEQYRRFVETYGAQYPIFPIAAVNGTGKEELLRGVLAVLKTLPPAMPIEAEGGVYETKSDTAFEIVRDDKGGYVVIGGLVDLLCRNVVLSDPDSMAYFQRTLRDKGVIAALQKQGCGAGDTVVVGDVEFEFIP